MVEVLVMMRDLIWFKGVGFSALCLLVFLCGCRSASRLESNLSTVQSENRTLPGIEEDVADYEDLAVLTEALLLVKRYYVEKSDYTDLVYSAIGGMLQNLDPNSSFLAPESLKSLDDSTHGKFVGIGVNVESGKEGVKVIAPLKDSPALKAGIKAGDTITSVNGSSLQGLSLGEAVEMMRGEKGSPVKVTVERADGVADEVELVREDVKLSCIESCRMLEHDIGYIRLKQFTSTTVDEVESSLKELVKRGAQKLVLDLRDNPGGVLSAAIGVSDMFLDKGSLIVSLKSRTADEPEHEYKSGRRGYKLTDMPLAILVNSGSASASEVVAGALQDNGRATLVGQRTFGKASVQSVVKMSLRPECAVKLTTGYYYTPSGSQIHGKGIKPGEEVLLTLSDQRSIKRYYMREAYRNHSPDDDQPVNLDDKQLDRAIAVLCRKEE